jgi:hypothetical protein
MANAWGELSWSIGSWGQQNDVSVSLTGQQLNNAQVMLVYPQKLMRVGED